MRIQNLNQRCNELLNEKEDMVAVHRSDKNIKEHLIVKMNELEKTCVEKTTEMLFEKRRNMEMREEMQRAELEQSQMKKEIVEYRNQVAKELKIMKRNGSRLSQENEAYKKVIEEMSIYFKKILSE